MGSGNVVVDSSTFGDGPDAGTIGNQRSGLRIDSGGSVEVTGSDFFQNLGNGLSATAFGGSIMLDGVAAYLNLGRGVDLSAWGPAGSEGNITITGVTVNNNTGGGISSSGILTLSNSTISGNGTTANGGGIYNENGTVGIINSTISGNSADTGGGIGNAGGTVTVTNSIISASTGGNCAGAVTDGGNNIDDGDTCGFGASSMSNTDPLLDPAGLQDNGGPTKTIALLPGSPAINAAAGCPATDQRGIARPQCGACDIGAYEFVFDSTTTTTTSSSNPSVFGSGVTFTATVTGGATGTVTFADGATTLCAAVSIAGTTATCSTSTLSVGPHTIAAAYSGDSTHCGSTGTVVQTVNKAATTTTITSDNPDPSAVGQAVAINFTVTANPPGGGTPTGNVTVTDGMVNCTGTVAAGTCMLALAAPGARTLTATYAGDANFDGSTSPGIPHGVNHANTATSLASSLNPSITGQAVTFTATVNVVAPGAGTPAGTVTFRDEAADLGTAALSGSGLATFSTSGLTAGTHSITAQYNGDTNFSGSTSSALNQLVYPTSVTIPTATGRGDIVLSTNSPGCWFSNVQAYTEEQVGTDPSFDYPFGLVGFTLNCAGPAEVSLTFTGATDLSGQPYRKYGPTTPGDLSTTKWYTYPDVTIAANMVTLHNLRNGQFGDDTGVEDGVIVDQGGPGGSSPAPIPTMTEWGMIMLSVLLGLGSVYCLRKRKLAA